jgi:hypothetical protein
MDCPRCHNRVCLSLHGWRCLSCRKLEHFPNRDAQKRLALLAIDKGYLLEMQIKDQGFFHVYDQGDRCCIGTFATTDQLTAFLDSSYTPHLTQP